MLVCSHDELESPHTLKTDTIARSELPIGGNHIFFTEIFTRSGIFFKVKLTECQCKIYKYFRIFSFISLNKMNYFYIKNLKQKFPIKQLQTTDLPGKKHSFGGKSVTFKLLTITYFHSKGSFFRFSLFRPRSEKVFVSNYFYESISYFVCYLICNI